MHTVVVGTSGVSASDVLAVARGAARIELSEEAVAALAAAREIVDALAAKPDPVYGVSTGFGALATRHISPELRAQLQRNIVRSHAAGMGPRVEREVVRALMFLRLKTVCSGHTGVRPEVAQTMADVLNAGITPVVHEYGSLGCSGDLAPLSHCALTLMGEGDAEGPDGVVRPAGELLAEHGIQPVELREKEGLALLNGTDGMLGMLVMALADLDTLYKSADITAALSLEALLGTDKVLAPELHAIRPHPGQGAAAANMLAVLEGSQLTGHHQDDAPRVQDAYSVRCAPQVAGAGRDTMALATDPDQAAELLPTLVKEMEDRYDLIKARQGIAPDTPDEEITSDIWGLPEDERPVPVVLFVDEVAELFLVATKKDEERRDEMVTRLIRLAQLGRAAGIYLEVCGQRFGAELGKGATMLRAQLTGRVCHRVNDEASAKMALGDIAPEAVHAACSIAPERPGLAVAGDTSGGWSRIRTPYLSLGDAAETCQESAHMVPDLAALKPFRPDVPVRPVDAAAPVVLPHPVTD
ncbi:aromatic amino acid lyase [Streptomyces sp. SID6139]|uniref:aromatic amino acid lyase n=1 Tax=Streptomyces sp. SID6139 TaxID=2690320 RepID=UPI0031FC2F12